MVSSPTESANPRTPYTWPSDKGVFATRPKPVGAPFRFPGDRPGAGMGCEWGSWVGFRVNSGESPRLSKPAAPCNAEITCKGCRSRATPPWPLEAGGNPDHCGSMETPRPRPRSFLTALRTVLLPNCREMSRLASHRLDHSLTLWQRLGARFHLLFCRLCRRYWKHLVWLRSVSRDPKAILARGPGLTETSRSRMKHTLKKHGLVARTDEGAGSVPDSL